MMYDLNLLKDFTTEASEHLDELEFSLLQLEVEPDNRELLNDIFRSIHSIKGAAQFVGLERISDLSHRLETLLELIRSDAITLNTDVIDTLIAAKDLLSVLNGELETTQSEQASITELGNVIDQMINPAATELTNVATEGIEQPATTESTNVATEGIEQPAATESTEVATEGIEQPAAPESSPAPNNLGELLQAENFVEQGDAELLDIFTGQLTEKLAALEGLPADTAPRAEKIRFLESAAQHLGVLRSAANYMGYDKLTVFYDRWRKTIDTTIGTAKEDGTIALEMFTEFLDVLQERLDGLKADTAPVAPTPKETPPDLRDHIENTVSDFLNMNPEDESAAILPEESDPAGDTPPAQAPTADGKIPPAEQTPATVQDAALLGDQLREESFTDEADVELRDIFNSQLNEKMAALMDVPPETAPQADKIRFLKSAGEHLDALRSAANYMGYQKLIEFYDQWLASIEAATGAVNLDGAVPLNFFTVYLKVLQDHFAGIMPDAVTEPDSSAPDTATGEAPVDDREPAASQNIEATVDRLFAEETPTANGAVTSGVPEDKGADLPEKNDAELYEIFLDHATDGIGALSRTMTFSEGAVTVEDLERSIQVLDDLHASANYMDYAELCAIYAQWQKQASAARDQLQADGFTTLAFWDDRLQRVLEHLPQVAARLADAPPLATDAAAMSHPAIMDVDIAPETDESQVPDTPDGALFDRLRQAFNTTLPGDLDDDGDIPLLEVLEEMIDGEGAITVPHCVIPESSSKSALGPAGSEENRPASPAHAAAPSPDATEPPLKKARTKMTDPTPAAQHKATDESIQAASKGPTNPAAAKKFKQSIRVDADKIDYLMNQVGELVVSRAFFAQLYNDLRGLHQELKEELGLDQKQLKPVREFSFRLGEATVALGRVSNELQEGVMKARMLPISQLFARYPRLVRDLVHNTDKQVTINTKGEETELDKMIIEAISDPLIHIIRNAVDHGIEPAEERRRQGKPASGTLTLEAYHESNHIVIEVTDDGRGIDLNRIRTKAIEGGLGTAEDFKRLSNRELMRLIMTPGFSTADQATRTSGRGVGMDVVRKNIEKLNGSIEIESEAGQQTRIRIKIPLTLAIIAALLVRVGEDIFTIPLSAVEETIRLNEADITTIEGVEVIHLRDKTTPILRLSNLFKLSSTSRRDGKHFIVIVNTGSHHVGLVVDALIGQEEVVIKPLPDYLREKSGFSGATIIGDGGISLILDVYELVNMTIRHKSRRRAHRASFTVPRPERPALAAPTVH